MQLDDRDIIGEQDYTPLSATELAAQIELYAGVIRNTPLADFDMELINGPARALAARVAELEAALAAQGWRPVTEEWPNYHDQVLIGHYGGRWAAFAHRVQVGDEDEWLLDAGRTLDLESAGVAMALPPLPPQEVAQ